VIAYRKDRTSNRLKFGVVFRQDIIIFAVGLSNRRSPSLFMNFVVGILLILAVFFFCPATVTTLTALSLLFHLNF
jgi:hypothetical protein